MPSLYDIIDDLRQEYPARSASRTLDMVVEELGQTQDNLRQALSQLEQQPIPAGSRPILEELRARARAEGVDDLQVPLTAEEVEMSTEPVSKAQIGIAVLLGGTAVLSLLLAGLVIASALSHG
jgi:hypothetical protein